MPEPLIHFIIPFFILIMLGYNVKKSALISSLAIVPDLDVLFRVHRSVSHSIFFILIFSIPITIMLLYLAKKFSKKFSSADAIMTTLVMLSHPFMDIFTGFTPILWPLFNQSVYIFTELTTNMNNILNLNLIFKIQFDKIIFLKTSGDAPIFTGQGIGISLVLLTGLVLKYFSNKFHNFSGLVRYVIVCISNKEKK